MRSAALMMFVLVVSLGAAQEGEPKKAVKKAAKKAGATVVSKSVSFKDDVLPVITKQCLPCHAEENFNPSELSLDSYDLMMKGGKHGELLVPGKSGESLLVKKLGMEPPFGGRMPLNSKKKIQEGKAKFLTDDEIKTITMWVNQGAKKN